jgi:hypothetical protein
MPKTVPAFLIDNKKVIIRMILLCRQDFNLSNATAKAVLRVISNPIGGKLIKLQNVVIRHTD